MWEWIMATNTDWPFRNISWNFINDLVYKNV